MDPGYRTPLIDIFRRGEVDRDVRLLAARGALVPRPLEQLALLVLLADDSDEDVASVANETLTSLPADTVRGFLAGGDVPGEMRAFFRARGIEPAHAAPAADPGAAAEAEDTPDLPGATGDAEKDARIMSALPIMDRIKYAMKGTREQRAQLIRDPNKVVAAAVLSSPKLTESEVEAFAKMANLSEEVLRVIGTNRSWMKNYGVTLALARNPKTPPGMSMQLLHRLGERDVKAISMDRNVPETLRLAARKMVVKSLK